MFGRKNARIQELEYRVRNLEIDSTSTQRRLRWLEVRNRLLMDHLGVAVREDPPRTRIVSINPTIEETKRRF